MKKIKKQSAARENEKQIALFAKYAEKMMIIFVVVVASNLKIIP